MGNDTGKIAIGRGRNVICNGYNWTDVMGKAAMGQDVMESVLSWDRMFFRNVNSAMLKKMSK